MDLCYAFILGLFGSLHCAGMCGPLTIALPTAKPSFGSFVSGRLAYNLGRIVTYCCLGLLFGLAGKALWIAGLQRWLSIGVGTLLLTGLFASRRLILRQPVTVIVEQLKRRMSFLMRRRSQLSLGLLGLLNGLLPCGLVYVAAAGALATGGVLKGAGYMFLFGLGTAPMMLAISLSGSLFPISLRLKLRRAIPVSVFILATLLILRGMSLGIPYVSPDLASGHPCCENR